MIQSSYRLVGAAAVLLSSVYAWSAEFSQWDPREQEVLRLVNLQREFHNLSSVQPDSRLQDAAIAHSRDMVARDFFKHNNPDGVSPSERVSRAGYEWTTTGENIAGGFGFGISDGQLVESDAAGAARDAMYGTQSLVEVLGFVSMQNLGNTVDFGWDDVGRGWDSNTWEAWNTFIGGFGGWMGSTGHRANILQRAYRDLGVGYTFEPDDGGTLTFGTYWTQNFAAGDSVVQTTMLAAAVLPASRSVQVGRPATAFATIINPSAATGFGCRISPAGNIAATFSYQTTDASNGLTGSPNRPVDIAGNNGAQSFVITLTPTSAFVPNDIAFDIVCNNIEAAPVLSGLNTLMLSASTTPVPDVVALVATTSNDGVLRIGGVGRAAAFAVATANVGAADDVEVRAGSGDVTDGLQISVCETNPTTGSCVNPTTPDLSEIDAHVGANATSTFAIFATATRDVAFDPARNRISVRFVDSQGITRGATSVAVTTE